MAKKVLFIDRDGTLVLEPNNYQLDSFSKLVFYPQVFTYLSRIANELGFELVMVTNQDGLGREIFPEETFWPVQDFIIKAFENEKVVFSEVCIDRSLLQEMAVTRKPRTGLLSKYIDNEVYDLKNSFVIGDRVTDVELAANLGCKAIFINSDERLGNTEVQLEAKEIEKHIALKTVHWEAIYNYLKSHNKCALIVHKTNETEISIALNLDGTGKSCINTGLAFFDHMLDQLARHGLFDVEITVDGDLHVDEHHTIEDTAIALGEAFLRR